MTSSSSFGCSVITLQFSLDLSIDIAEQEVQAAINAGGTFLPRDLPNPPIYSKVNPADTPILTLALTSKTLPLPRIEDLADTTLAQKISQLTGVGLVRISGGQKPGVRIRVNPTELAAYGLGLEDVRTALASANVDQAKGNFESDQQIFTIGANDQIMSSTDYQKIIVAYRKGAPVRLADIANVVDGVENTKQAAWMNEQPAVIVNIQRQPGANIIAVVDRIKALLPQLKASLPSSVDLSILTDRTTTIRASVTDVQFELMKIVQTDPAVQNVSANVSGTRGYGQLNIQLKPIGERNATADQVIARLRPKTQLPGASLFLQSAQEIRIGGRGSNSQFQYTIQGDTVEELQKWANIMLDAINALPEVRDSNTDLQNRGLEARLVIDRDTASRLGVTPQTIDNALYSAFGQRQVSTMYKPLNQYHVIMV